MKITEQADDDELDFVSLDEEMQQFHTVQTRGNRKALTEQENKVKPFSTVNSERPKRKASSYTDQPDSKQSLVSPNTSLDPSEDEADSASREKAKPGLSDYEKEVLKNVEERKKLFRMIVGEAKAEFMQALPSREVVAKNKLASAYNKSKDKRKVEKE